MRASTTRATELMQLCVHVLSSEGRKHGLSSRGGEHHLSGLCFFLAPFSVRLRRHLAVHCSLLLGLGCCPLCFKRLRAAAASCMRPWCRAQATPWHMSGTVQGQHKQFSWLLWSTHITGHEGKKRGSRAAHH